MATCTNRPWRLRGKGDPGLISCKVQSSGQLAEKDRGTAASKQRSQAARRRPALPPTASLPSLATSLPTPGPPVTGHVYLLRSPMVGQPWEGLHSAGLLPKELALHEAVVLHTEETEDTLIRLYDFLPEAPEDLRTIQTLLLGGRAPGLARQRTLPAVPRLWCSFLGPTHLSDPHLAAEHFQRDWDPRLQLLVHDCRTHAAALTRLLLSAGT